MPPIFNIPKTKKTYLMFAMLMLLISIVAFDNLPTYRFLEGWDDYDMMDRAAKIAANPWHLFSSDDKLPIRFTHDIYIALVYGIWGENIAVFRTLQVALHLLAALLLVRIFVALGADLELSFASALLFLTNAAHFRTIHWLYLTNYILAFIAALGVLYFQIHFYKTGKQRYAWSAAIMLGIAIFSHPSAISVALFCLYYAWRQGDSFSQFLQHTKLIFIAALIWGLLSYSVSPSVAQTEGFVTIPNIGRLFQNFFWYLGRLVDTAHWITKTTVTNEVHLWEIGIGILVVCAFFLLLCRKVFLATDWLAWTIIAILPFVNTLIPRLCFGPSRQLYFASAGFSLVLAWGIRAAIQRLIYAFHYRRLSFATALTLLCITGIVALRKAEALTIYFAGRGFAYRIQDHPDNMRRAADLFEQAIRHAPEILPDDAYLRLASMGFPLGKPFHDIFDAGIKLFPGNETIAMLQGVSMFLDIDQKQWHKGEEMVSLAFNNARSKEALASDTALVFHNLAGYYQKQEQHEKAIFLFQKALKYNHSHITAYVNMGKSLVLQGKIEEAIAGYRQAMAHNPEYAAALQQLGIMLFDKGNQAEALSIFEELAHLDATNSTAQYNLGVILAAMGDLAKSEEALKKAAILNPSDIDMIQSLAEVYYLQKKYTEAIQTFQQGMNLQPDNAQIAYNLGILLAQTNRVAEATNILQRAIEIHPRDIDLHLALAEAYKHQKKIEDAVTTYRRILAIEPHHPDAIERLNALVP